MSIRRRISRIICSGEWHARARTQAHNDRGAQRPAAHIFRPPVAPLGLGAQRKPPTARRQCVCLHGSLADSLPCLCCCCLLFVCSWQGRVRHGRGLVLFVCDRRSGLGRPRPGRPSRATTARGQLGGGRLLVILSLSRNNSRLSPVFFFFFPLSFRALWFLFSRFFFPVFAPSRLFLLCCIRFSAAPAVPVRPLRSPLGHSSTSPPDAVLPPLHFPRVVLLHTEASASPRIPSHGHTLSNMLRCTLVVQTQRALCGLDRDLHVEAGERRRAARAPSPSSRDRCRPSWRG